ncbi:MAG: pyrroline-5-carboxylate reductase [Thermodesulfobacteriota bacterium]|nr:pyrroline-5-carboxylate reductase [Thermodesulfobacteriota bacterium]
MLKDKIISLIGAGNMGSALLNGLVQSKTARPENIICTDIRESQLDQLRQEVGVRTMTDNLVAVREADIVIYAVKPQILPAVLQQTAEALDLDKVVISIAAGVSLAAIESKLEKKLRLVRVMPNICASVGMGASAIAAGKHVKEGDIELAKEIFDSVGTSIFIGENVLMDAITGLSGSGPAYIFLIIDAMADAGVKMGLYRGDALALSAQTVLGAAKMLIETGEHPGLLKDQVTSPGGTAIAGLHTLEKGGLRTTIINAVEAATLRSKELGRIIDENFINSKE